MCSLCPFRKSSIGVLSPRFSRPDGLGKCRGHLHLRGNSTAPLNPGTRGQNIGYPLLFNARLYSANSCSRPFREFAWQAGQSWGQPRKRRRDDYEASQMPEVTSARHPRVLTCGRSRLSGKVGFASSRTPSTHDLVLQAQRRPERRAECTISPGESRRGRHCAVLRAESLAVSSVQRRRHWHAALIPPGTGSAP